MSTTYKVGQVLTANRDILVEMEISGETKVIPKGSIVIIGADNLGHHPDGCIQPLSKDTIVEGYDAEGLAGWIVSCLCCSIPCLEEALEDYDVDLDEVQSGIASALDEIGF